MIKFKELREAHGAGDWGTDKARKRLEKDTPNQGITDIGLKNKERKESVEFAESDYKVIKVVGDDFKKMKKDRIYGTFPATDKGRDQATLFQLKLKSQKGIETTLVWESLDESQWGADNPYKKYKNDPVKLKRMLKKNQEAEGSMRNRIRKFMGSAPSGLKDELKDIEKRIKQIKDVMREEVELDELSPVTKMKATLARGIRGPSKKATPNWARETGKAAKELKKRAAQKAEYEKKKKAMQQRGALTSFKEGSESWEAGYKRRVVKTTDPDHKEKGYNWRIKGKDRPEISIKLYKDKPSFDEFKKQMKRVAGHEFGG